MEMRIDGTVGRAIIDYVDNHVELLALDYHPDPKVPGTYAFRATVRQDYLVNDRVQRQTATIDFLVSGVALGAITADDLEEVEFVTWPPTSGR